MINLVQELSKYRRGCTLLRHISIASGCPRQMSPCSTRQEIIPNTILRTLSKIPLLPSLGNSKTKHPCHIRSFSYRCITYFPQSCSFAPVVLPACLWPGLLGIYVQGQIPTGSACSLQLLEFPSYSFLSRGTIAADSLSSGLFLLLLRFVSVCSA